MIIVQAKNMNTLSKIQQKITENCIILVQNPYGNYTVQAALDVYFILILELGNDLDFSDFKRILWKIIRSFNDEIFLKCC